MCAVIDFDVCVFVKIVDMDFIILCKRFIADVATIGTPCFGVVVIRPITLSGIICDTPDFGSITLLGYEPIHLRKSQMRN